MKRRGFFGAFAGLIAAPAAAVLVGKQVQGELPIEPIPESKPLAREMHHQWECATTMSGRDFRSVTWEEMDPGQQRSYDEANAITRCKYCGTRGFRTFYTHCRCCGAPT